MSARAVPPLSRYQGFEGMAGRTVCPVDGERASVDGISTTGLPAACMVSSCNCRRAGRGWCVGFAAGVVRRPILRRQHHWRAFTALSILIVHRRSEDVYDHLASAGIHRSQPAEHLCLAFVFLECLPVQWSPYGKGPAGQRVAFIGISQTHPGGAMPAATAHRHSSQQTMDCGCLQGDGFVFHHGRHGQGLSGRASNRPMRTTRGCRAHGR